MNFSDKRRIVIDLYPEVAFTRAIYQGITNGRNGYHKIESEIVKKSAVRHFWPFRWFVLLDESELFMS